MSKVCQKSSLTVETKHVAAVKRVSAEAACSEEALAYRIAVVDKPNQVGSNLCRQAALVGVAKMAVGVLVAKMAVKV